MHREAPATPANWVVAATRQHRESFALENLSRQGFTAYCPMIKKHIRHARRAFDAPRPLFPGYLFVEYEAGPHRSRAMLGTYGVRFVVCHGETPARLPEGFVESLKAREIGGVISLPEASFAPGQEVAIRGGPFDGLIGRIAGIGEHDRVLVLLDLLNRQAKVHVPGQRLRLV